MWIAFKIDMDTLIKINLDNIVFISFYQNEIYLQSKEKLNCFNIQRKYNDNFDYILKELINL